MRKTIPAHEHETSFYSNYALIALGLCGGSKHREIIRIKAVDLLKDKLTEGDRQYRRRKRDGREVPTTKSYPGTKWVPWHLRFHVALSNLVDDGLVTRNRNVFTLTNQGIKQLATLAQSGV
jgi:hypothetical protein